jgi:PIN domain nuclease of toxin-antitoxin system
VRLLLDTHTILWFALDDPQLSVGARSLIVDAAHEKFVSPASYWEIAIKIGAGKYVLAQPYAEFNRQAVDMNGFSYLHIEPRHTELLTTMAHHHKDPFDRLLAAQALVEGMLIVSQDALFERYGVQRLW